MTKVHAVLERGGPAGDVLLGIFDDRAHAIDVGVSHATHRQLRCQALDRDTFGSGADDIHYVMTKEDVGSTYRIGLTARPFDAADAMTWIVDTRDTIPPPPVEQPVSEGLSPRPGDLLFSCPA